MLQERSPGTRLSPVGDESNGRGCPMPTLLQRKMDDLKKEILFLGATVEERVKDAVRAVETWDTELAEKIIESDYDINEKEVEIEEACLEIIARYQPVAVDLRFLSAIIKINNDLERIGDEAVNIAERVLIVAKDAKAKFTFDYSAMAEKAEFMLEKSLDALVNLDLDLANSCWYFTTAMLVVIIPVQMMIISKI
jgi:phosphate transport system protein